jgi:hypothetical protein
VTSDPRFGIELYDAPAGPQRIGDTEGTLVGHVWSLDAERLAVRDDGRVVLVDPGGRNPLDLNRDLEALREFLGAFGRYYAGDRPAAPAPMTKAEARERLAALQRGDAAPAVEAPEKVPRETRLDLLRAELEAADPEALAAGSWWSRVLAEVTARR